MMSKMFPPSIGGAETYAYELANALGQIGNKVDVYTQRFPNKNGKIDTNENVNIIRTSRALRGAVAFETIIYSAKSSIDINFSEYDVIHGTLMPSSAIAVTSGKKMVETPIVLTSHGTSLGEAKSIKPRTLPDYIFKYFYHPANIVLDKLSGSSADTIIAYSRHSYEQLNKEYGFEEDKLKFIPGGVNTDRFRRTDKNHKFINPQKTSLLYVGRLGPRKGIDRAIRAVSRVNHPNLEFVVVGDGRLRDYLGRLSKEEGVENKVKFVGTVPFNSDELINLYSSADIFVLPSDYEGFGLVLLEAMSCGTPVIGTKAGGIPSVIGNNEGGYLVDKSVEGLANAIRKMCEDEELRNEYAHKAYERAQKHDWLKIAKRVEKVYKNIQ